MDLAEEIKQLIERNELDISGRLRIGKYEILRNDKSICVIEREIGKYRNEDCFYVVDYKTNKPIIKEGKEGDIDRFKDYYMITKSMKKGVESWASQFKFIR